MVAGFWVCGFKVSGLRVSFVVYGLRASGFSGVWFKASGRIFKSSGFLDVSGIGFIVFLGSGSLRSEFLSFWV